MPVKSTFEGVEQSAQDKRKYRLITLQNDLTVLLISDPETEKSSAAANVHVGSWSDPEEALGLAHFLEHMLFLGTEKYPDENSYHAYLNLHGGHSNAFTDQEDTNYFFDVQNDFFEGALDIFAQFFISPLFTESATDRELNAVDSENSKNLQEDSWRLFQLNKNLARPDHPFHKFSTGNLQTLKEAPAQSGVDIRRRLLDFHATFYSSNVMKLVVLGKEPLDTLQTWIDEKFSAVPNKNLTPPSFPGEPFPPAQLRKLVKVVPVKDVRSLQLMWPLPSVLDLYRTKPTNFLSHLIGHESDGSITALLKEKGWANELVAGISNSYSDFSTFYVSIELTEAGLEHMNEVALTVFRYIAMLKAAGPQEWIYHEIRDVANASFRFLHKTQPMGYTSMLASNMQRYAPEHIISGQHLMFGYNPEEITSFLERLTPQNFAMLIAHQGLEEETPLREQWYGTAYDLIDIDAKLLEELTNAGPVPELHLPDRNPFIPTDFELKARVVPVPQQEQQLESSGLNQHESAETSDRVEPDSPAEHPTSPRKPREYPVRLSATDDVVFWYKQDNTYDMPKVYVGLQFITPVAYESPASCAMTEVYSRCLEETLNRFSYYASVASLHFNVSVTRFGLDVSVSGFNHKAPVLISTIVETMKSMQISGFLFDRIKDKVLKTYRNFAFKQPYQHAVYYGSVCMEWPRWTHDEKYQALLPITVEQVQAFQSRLLTASKIEVLLNGNASPEECRQLAATVRSNLGAAPLPVILEPENRVVMLEGGGQTYIYRRPVFNPEEINSCVNNMYIFGALNVPIYGLTALFQHIVSEPFFDTLRTKAQLGYIVHIGRTYLGANIVAMQALIQSNTKDPSYLDTKIEEFFQEYRETLATMPEEEFNNNVSAVIEQLLEKPKNLVEESRQLWTHIESGRYDFEMREETAAWMRSVTRESLLQFFDTYLGSSSPTRRKLSVQIYGNKHTVPSSTGAGQTIINDVTAFRRMMPALGRAVPHGRVNRLYDFVPNTA